MTNVLWLVWKQPDKRRRYLVGVLTREMDHYKFNYIHPELNDALKDGFEYFPGFQELGKIYEHHDLFSNITTRLPNPARPDYLEILNLYGLDKDSDDMEILKVTRGRLLTDNFEFVAPFDASKIEFEIAGTRYYDAKTLKNSINLNDNLFLMRDETNAYDEFAIKVICKQDGEVKTLGYVPRYYSKQLTKLLEDKVNYSAKVKTLKFSTPLDDEDITVDVKLIFDVKNKLR